MIRLDKDQLEAVAERAIERVGDTPFTSTPYFFLSNGRCDVYVNDVVALRYGAVMPHTPCPEVYTFGTNDMDAAEIEGLAQFLATLDARCGLIVPAALVPGIRAHRCVDLEVEGLCFTFSEIPPSFQVHRPGRARRLLPADAGELERLPSEAGFLWQAFGSPAALLAEGMAFGVLRNGHLASAATTLVITPGYGDVGVYTVRRYRHRGYATDCVEALFAHLFSAGRRPLWRIGARQKLAIRFAERLAMEEIGTNGREVYVHME